SHFRINITLDHGFNIILIHNHPPDVTQGLSSSGAIFFRFFFLTGGRSGSGRTGGSALSLTHSSQVSRHAHSGASGH
ncbi:hypothetical protein JZM29_28445, partial [Escherichia coli]|nr:hypothetical protein [Escherichia coli]